MFLSLSMKKYRKKIQFSTAVAFVLLAIALLCTLCSRHHSKDKSSMLPVGSDSNAAFETYTEELFRSEASANLLTLRYTLENPEAYGIIEYNTQLTPYSADGILAAASCAESVLKELEKYPDDSLSAENRLTRDILADSLEQSKTAAGFCYYDEPLRPSTGVQSELPILLAEYTIKDKQDVSDYLSLLSSIPAYLDGVCRYEREKLAAGLFMSDFAAEKIMDQCLDFAESGKENYLIYTFEQKLDDIPLSQNERRDYKKQNQTLVLKRILPAFRSLANTLEELKDTGKNPAGLCHFPEGKRYYETLVRNATGSADSVSELKERTENQRLSDLTLAGQILDSDSVLEQKLSSISLSSEKPEEILQSLQETIRKDFPSPPECQYTIKYVDSAMEEYLAPAFYLSSPLDNPAENCIYVNQGNGYEGIRLFTTLAHEGFPGHLYQNVMFHTSSPPAIRTLLGYSGYSEGWATYVEFLSYRYAGLEENVASVLALDQSAILSLYATADMGIHYDGWSYTDTWQFFSSYGIDDEGAVRDIFELIVEEPAHYLKYYIGYLEFLDLRKEATEKMGERFSLKKFHEAVLEIGPAPFDILRKYLPVFY